MPPPTWPEARAAKAERQRREARYFHPGNTARHRCRRCGGPMSAALAALGDVVHPCCEPEFVALTRRAEARS